MQRKEFGSGRLGEKAWQLVSFGVPCEAIIGGHQCGIPAIGTTDYDVLGDAEITPHCSEEHHRLIMEGVNHDLSAQGRSTVFGRNGFGRA